VSRDPEPSDPDGGPGARGLDAWRRKLTTIAGWLTTRPPVVLGLGVMRLYGEAGGGLLAAGLSFFALFTLVPALLLMVSLLGYFVADPALQEEIVEMIVSQVPPLEDVARQVLRGLAAGAQAATIIGLAGAAWGASGFYAALQDAMERIFPGRGNRNPIITRVRGLVSVLIVIGGLLAVVVVGLTVPVVTEFADIDLGPLAVLATPAIICLFASFACFVVYVAVPSNAPPARLTLLPAVVAGVAIGLLTSFFGLLAPFLVRNAAALGILGTVFVTLVWFNFTFQLLLYGAAFAGARWEQARGGPTIQDGAGEQTPGR
jgi:membrane protein